MRNNVTITVNGKRRRTIQLAAPQPIPNMEYLSLAFESVSAPDFYASRDDYRRGAYRFLPSLVHMPRPGTYRSHAVVIYYTDGTSAESPLVDAIIVEVAAIPKRPEHLPLFSAL
jgi:hypothetical protein